jgi:hypothetical protein
MCETGGQLGAVEDSQRSHGVGAPSLGWSSMTAAVTPHKVPNFEGVLLAMAGHDLRQPLQVIQSAHELLKCGSERAPSSGVCGPVKLRLTVLKSSWSRS